MFLRRCAAALAATTVLCTATALPAAAAPASDDGLYGEGDPKYDGVWRQSLALLAQDTAGVKPAPAAVDWLVSQQCGDGSFAAYRADTGAKSGAKCGKKTTIDVNATAAAVQALSALGGHGAEVKKSVGWLKTVQNDDGGWGYNPGSPSDTNSVSVVIGALDAAGENPAKTRSEKGGNSPFDSLRGFQLDCGAKPAERGAFAYQPDKKGDLVPNADATAAAALAGHGTGLVVKPVGKGDKSPAEAPSCEYKAAEPDGMAEAGAAYLAATMKKNDDHLQSAMPGTEDQPDYSNTADAVIALAAGGHGTQARAVLDWLETNVESWDKSQGDPAALGQLVLAAHAAGGDPRAFGGVDLIERLNATGPEPVATAGAKNGEQTDDSAAENGAEKEDEGDNSTVLTLSLIGAGLAAGAGIGILLSERRKRQSQ